MSISLILVISVYSLLRFYCSRIGGMYCFKRIAVGVVFGLVSVEGGVDRNVVLFCLGIVAVEIVFVWLRCRY